MHYALFSLRAKTKCIILQNYRVKFKCKEGIRMFNVKKTEHTNKTFRMPVELVKKLELLAQEKNVSLNNLVIQCCEYALENLEDREEE